MDNVRVRMAPSPTGSLHVGNGRTALFNYLFAKNQKGKYILRIEDTDQERSTAENERLAIDDLLWMGLEWDEGIERGGDYGPYRQTDRLDIYNSYINRLLDNDLSYSCFCTKEELAQEKERAIASGKPYIYSGRCRNLSQADLDKKLQSKDPYVVRLKTNQQDISFTDIVKGNIVVNSDSFGDFVLKRSDGMPVYNFTCVIDEITMQISHVIRGDDHLSNTPKQILIYQALGESLPQFAHVPMILGADKSKLSKRHGSTSIAEFRRQGYLPEALLNFLVLLSWSPGTEQEIFTKDELVEKFSLDRVNSSAAIFDFTKLKWMNGMYIRALSEGEYLDRVKPFVAAAEFDASIITDNEAILNRVLLLVRDSLEILSDVVNAIKPFCHTETMLPDSSQDVVSWENSLNVISSFKDQLQAIEDNQELTVELYKSITKSIQADVGVKGKQLFMPIRVGLTGLTAGPELADIFTLLPKSELLNRLESLLDRVAK